MFTIQHAEAIKVIKGWLDDISYSTLNWRIMQFLDQTGQLYPDFIKFVGNISRINPLYAFIFSVFRLGQPTERIYLDTFLPANVIEALLKTGLLRQKGKYYQMPEVGIVPLRGMYFVSGLPEVYPTVKRDILYKQVDDSAWIMMDEIVSQPVGGDFLELDADYGILANMAAVKGFKNIQIYPKHSDYIPFIHINLALNQHNGEVIIHSDTKKYDLIAGTNLSVKAKNVSRNLTISDETDINQLFSVFGKLKESGQAIVLLESTGTISEITVNKWLKDIKGYNVKSIVMNKVPYLSFAMTSYVQSSWEKQFELIPREYVDYVRKTIELSDSKAFVFTQLLKIDKQKTDEPFVLYPFYNPKYSDPLFNYASLTV